MLRVGRRKRLGCGQAAKVRKVGRGGLREGLGTFQDETTQHVQTLFEEKSRFEDSNTVDCESRYPLIRYSKEERRG